MKTCNKKGEAEMHWTAGQLAGLLRHPVVPDCIPLYHRISFNLFLNYFKLYLIVNNDKLRMAPRCLFCFTQTCPVYRLLTVTVEYEPSLQVFFLFFFIGIPLLCWFTCPHDYFFCNSFSSSCYGL